MDGKLRSQPHAQIPSEQIGKFSNIVFVVFIRRARSAAVITRDLRPRNAARFSADCDRVGLSFSPTGEILSFRRAPVSAGNLVTCGSYQRCEVSTAKSGSTSGKR